jgi:hypothetical protein
MVGAMPPRFSDQFHVILFDMAARFCSVVYLQLADKSVVSL